MGQINHNRILHFVWYSMPVIIIAVLVLLTKSSLFQTNASRLAPAIILDLLIILPLVYFLIIRKKSIPKTTVVLVLVIGVVTATFIIPEQHQGLLDAIKFWVLPFVELFVVTYVFFTIRKSIKAFKKNNTGQFDFFSNLKAALADIMPVKVIPFVAMEISAFYYGFIKWKKNALASNEYSYHKESGTKAILLVLLFLVAIETFVFHLLLIRWSPVIAWVLTGLSIYSAFQIIGILKSLIHRPIVITDSCIELKYGILADAELAIENIESISIQKEEVTKESGILSFSPLGDLEGHNVLITLKSKISISGFYGMKKEAEKIALFVDEPDVFIKTIESKTI